MPRDSQGFWANSFTWSMNTKALVPDFNSEPALSWNFNRGWHGDIMRNTGIYWDILGIYWRYSELTSGKNHHWFRVFFCSFHSTKHLFCWDYDSKWQANTFWWLNHLPKNWNCVKMGLSYWVRKKINGGIVNIMPKYAARVLTSDSKLKLVGDLEHFFPYLGNNHPIWPIFFRGVGQPPTSKTC